MKYWLAVLFCACAPVKPRTEAPCVSSCGMLIEDKGNGSLSCDAVNDAEQVVLAAANETLCPLDYRFCLPYSCGQIFGWQARLKQEPVWVTLVEFKVVNGAEEEIAIPVSGVSNCRPKIMELGSDISWRRSSYAHELFHIIQNCDGGGEESEFDATYGSGHEGWEAMGVFDLIEDIKQ